MNITINGNTYTIDTLNDLIVLWNLLHMGRVNDALARYGLDAVASEKANSLLAIAHV